MSTDLAKLEPQVLTVARPSGPSLLAARTIVDRDAATRAVFLQAKAEGWDANRLAEALVEPIGALLEGSPVEVQEVSRYLADEFQQIGDGILIISTTTGQAIAKLTDDDYYTPTHMVPREGGGMAKPLPRIRPELEGFIVRRAFDDDREARAEQRLAARLHQTELLQTEGDPRLKAVTRRGRKSVAEEVQDRLPTAIFEATGVAKDFLQFFNVQNTLDSVHLDDDWTQLPKRSAIARTSTLIADLQALNLRHNHVSAALAKISTQWVRDIARTLSIEAQKFHVPSARAFDSLTAADMEKVKLWVGDPNFTQACQASFPGQRLLPADGAEPCGLLSTVGVLLVHPDGFKFEHREYHDRWEMNAAVEYTLFVCGWETVRSLNLTDVPVTGVSVELVSR